MDLAGKDYWDGFWHKQYGRQFAGFSHFQSRMSALLAKYSREGCTACEIGCGGSTWMPVLASRGVRVWGIDYSEIGIALARTNLERAGADAHLVRGDVRQPHSLPVEAFDVVFSSGFIEHFDDPVAVLAAIVQSLRPDGVLITLVPNFAGVWGEVQRKVDARVFALHTVYTGEALDEVHRKAGLAPVEPGRYFGGFGPLVVNYTRPLSHLPAVLRTALIGGTWVFQQVGAWSLAAVGARDAAYSSHIAGVYSKNGQPATTFLDQSS